MTENSTKYNCGTLCFSTDQGIGILAKEFYRNEVLTDALVVAHGRRTENPRWFAKDGKLPEQLFSLYDNASLQIAKNYCLKHKSMLFIETPFLWELIPFCRANGIKTTLMVMYECMPIILPEVPDIILCPSKLDYQYYTNSQYVPSKYSKINYRVEYLPVPVEVEWSQRTRAEVFVHNAGNGGLKGRNGTIELLKSIPLVKSPAKFIIRSQVRNEEFAKLAKLDNRIEYIQDNIAHRELYNRGDVFIFPEKFNGLSLPLQEAYASGMAIIATNRFPMRDWLPCTYLVQVSDWKRSAVSPRCLEFDEAVVTPENIASTIDRCYGTDITEYSQGGMRWAESMSWDKLKPEYIKLLQ